MNKFLSILLLCAAVSCNGAATTDMPEWRWGEVETPSQKDPYPEYTRAGWKHVTADFQPALPEGISIYRSPDELGGQKVIAFIAIADTSLIAWDVKSIDDPAISGTREALKTPSAYYSETAAPVILNGGYFFSEGGKQYNASVAVSAGRTYGVNINYASLDWKTMYYPTRGVFYQMDGKIGTGWTYWGGGARHYLYEKPSANSWEADPLPVPDATFPEQAKDFAPQTAIGGGPVLIKGRQPVNTWKEELFYGNGAEDKMPLARHPRSAIGITGEGRLLLFVCEGRGMTPGVAGMTFAEEAEVLKSLGCTDAMNLDGGGSSCLLVQGQKTIQCSDGGERAVGSVIILKKK